jgi:hypothetical protein
VEHFHQAGEFMKSKLIYILATVATLLLIGVSGFLAWYSVRQVSQLQPKYVDALLEKYASTGDLSYLLEATIVSPDKLNLQGTTDILLQNGEYQTAKTINYFLKDPDFNLKTAEAALFNLDYTAANYYLGLLPDDAQIQELIIFRKHLTEFSDATMEWEPQTNAGKLLTMVAAKDFSLYPIPYEIGGVLAEINEGTDKDYRKRLLAAQNMSDFGYTYLALNVLTDSPGACNQDYFLIKAKTYDALSLGSEAISTINQGLKCDPVNIDLLKRAADYNIKIGNPSQADFYLSRINYLNQISKEQ